jgi:hypothetical protein
MTYINKSIITTLQWSHGIFYVKFEMNTCNQLLNYKNKLFDKTILILFKKIIKLKWFKLNVWLVQLNSTPTNMIPFLKNWNKNQIAMVNDL